MPQQFTLLEDGRPLDMQATIADGRVLLRDDEVRTKLGWELKVQGLCQGDLCIPVREPDALARPEGIDLVHFAKALGRPLALDLTERAAALADSASTRREALQSLDAPEFSLPDFSGKHHSLSQYRGKKVLLIAYASW